MGWHIRIRISDVFGARPLRIGDVRVALSAGGGRTVPGSSRRVTFRGRDQVTVRAGRREFSDPVAMRVGDGQNLAVSIYVKYATGPASWHPAAITTVSAALARTSARDGPSSAGSPLPARRRPRRSART